MADKYKILVRSDSTENWANVNPLLDYKEISYDTTANLFKVGDGLHNWNELEYVGSVDLSNYYTKDEVDALLEEKVDVNTYNTKITEIEINIEKKADVEDIPTVNDGTITIKQGTETKGTFTLNQDGDTTITLSEGVSSVDWDDIQNKPEFSDVATSGSYNDLTDTPAIPTVNDGTITIKQGDITKGQFTLNQSGDTTISLDEGGSSVEKDIHINSIKKIDDYFYQIQYNHDYDYDYAKAYFDDADTNDGGGCSVMTDGNMYCRNLDWYYSNDVEFLVKTPHTDHSYGNIGICHSVDGLTKEFVESGEWSDAYKIVPFRIVDGMNEYGLYCNVNVVSALDLDVRNTGTTPAVEQRDRICTKMLTRYILDNFKTATEAVEHLRDYVSIYSQEGEYEYHYMVSDSENVYVIEFVDNELSILEHQKIMTNFRLTDVDIEQTIDYSTISKYGAGVERYEKMMELVGDISDADTNIALMRDVWYTNTYDANVDWLTEFTGDYTEQLGYELTVQDAVSDPDKFNTVKQYAMDLYANRNRGRKDTWQTVHTAIYDRQNRTLTVCVQQDNTNHYTFNVPHPQKVEWNDVVNKPNFANVATSGSYNDLTNKPEIGNGSLTIARNGIGVGGQFFANQSTSNYVDIQVPTYTSQLENNSDFVTKHTTELDWYTTTADMADVALSGDYNDLTNKPTLNTEVWTFVDELGNTITKTVYVNND